MIINHNLGSMNAQRNMGINSTNASKSMEKLSSGLRINKAGDDAAGLAISEKMRGQIRGLDQASANAQDGISMIGTAEGALSETHSILQRMRELAVQSSNDTNVAVDRGEIQKEMDELAKEVTRIANNTEFNTQKLINGGIKDDGIKSTKFHVGANANQDITLSINAMDAKSLGVSRDVSTVTGTGAGIVSSATFGTSVGNNVVDGAAITFNYAAGGAGSAATAGELTGANFASADLSGIDAGTSLTINVDGTDYDLGNAALAAWDNAAGHNAIGDVAGFLGAAVSGGAVALSTVADITNDGSKITITSKTTGTSSNVTFSITDGAADTAAIQGVFGINSAATDTGAATVAATSSTVTVSDGTDSQVVDVADGTATSFSVTAGKFSGMSISASGAISGLDNVNDTLALSTTVSAASKAVFSGNALQSQAVTEAGIDVSTQATASTAITTIQNAIETVSAERSKLGASQNRLEHTIANLGTSSENLTSAESRIRDVDMAKEMSTFSKNNILSQAAQAMLAQANQQPQQVLQLLR